MCLWWIFVPACLWFTSSCSFCCIPLPKRRQWAHATRGGIHVRKQGRSPSASKNSQRATQYLFSHKCRVYPGILFIFAFHFKKILCWVSPGLPPTLSSCLQDKKNLSHIFPRALTFEFSESDKLCCLFEGWDSSLIAKLHSLLHFAGFANCKDGSNLLGDWLYFSKICIFVLLTLKEARKKKDFPSLTEYCYGLGR